jgi:hypothetical protein
MDEGRLEKVKRIISTITAKQIASDIIISKNNVDKKSIFKSMIENDFDVFFVYGKYREHRYYLRKDFEKSVEDTESRELIILDLITANTQLINVLKMFGEEHIERLFIIDEDKMISIITLADFQKQPVYLFAYSFLSLFEMLLNEYIRKELKANIGFEVKICISDERYEKAEERLSDLKKKNEAIDLIECLDIVDKWKISTNKDILRKDIFGETKKERDSKSERIKNLRDSTMHTRSILTEFSTKTLHDTIYQIQDIIEKIENYLYYEKTD